MRLVAMFIASPNAAIICHQRLFFCHFISSLFTLAKISSFSPIIKLPPHLQTSGLKMSDIILPASA